MRAGPLRHRVNIEKPVTVQDATGDPVVTWTLVASNVPAAIAPLSVREFMAGAVGPMASQLTAKITLRYRDMDPTMRITHRKDGRTDLYNIAGILPDPDSGREYIILPVTRGVNDG
jgi:SPP1 family predicted phage head-tail adaptor